MRNRRNPTLWDQIVAAGKFLGMGSCVIAFFMGVLMTLKTSAVSAAPTMSNETLVNESQRKERLNTEQNAPIDAQAFTLDKKELAQAVDAPHNAQPAVPPGPPTTNASVPAPLPSPAENSPPQTAPPAPGAAADAADKSPPAAKPDTDAPPAQNEAPAASAPAPDATAYTVRNKSDRKLASRNLAKLAIRKTHEAEALASELAAMGPNPSPEFGSTIAQKQQAMADAKNEAEHLWDLKWWAQSGHHSLSEMANDASDSQSAVNVSNSETNQTRRATANKKLADSVRLYNEAFEKGLQTVAGQAGE